MKNILLLAHDDAGQEARLQAALDVTRHFGGHLNCLDVAIVPEVIGNYYGGLGKAILVRDESEQEALNRARLETRLAVEQLPWSFETRVGPLCRAIREASVFADLIVLNRDLDFLLMPAMSATLGDALVKTRVPVLAVGYEAAGIDLGGPAVIAWDGSPTAIAAVRASVPFLRQSTEVLILAVDDGSIELPAEDAATYLSRHGVLVTVKQEGAGGRHPPDVVLEAVARTGASYVVMGGYGHSPMIEGLLGGMTRKMLRESPVPLFLAH